MVLLRTNAERVQIDDLQEIKIIRATRILSPHQIAVHDKGAAALRLWIDLRRQFPKYSLVSQAASIFAIQHIPLQAKKVGAQRWQVFGGFDAYAELQELESPTSTIRCEIQEFQKISNSQVEAISLILLLHHIEAYSICDSVAHEQIRRRIKTGFSKHAQDLVLTANATSQQDFAAATGISISKLKRQASILAKPPGLPSEFLHRILNGGRHET